MEQEYAPGDVVETTFGAGVVTQCPVVASDEKAPCNFYRVMLWRMPGQSVGSSSVAYLQPSAVRRMNRCLFWILHALVFDTKRLAPHHLLSVTIIALVDYEQTSCGAWNDHNKM